MARRKKDEKLETLYDIADRVLEDLPGDYRVGRTLNAFIVPPGSNDGEITGVAFNIMSQNTPDAGPNYSPIQVEPGEYDITVLVHMRKRRDFAALMN